MALRHLSLHRNITVPESTTGIMVAVTPAAATTASANTSTMKVDDIDSSITNTIDTSAEPQVLQRLSEPDLKPMLE